MLVSSYFLIGRRFCRRCFILSGLFVFAVGVYLVIAFLRLVGPTSDPGAPKPPLCLRPQLDQELANLPLETPRPLRCHEDEPDWIDPSNGTFQITSAARRRHGDVVCQYIPILRGSDDFQIVHGRAIKPIRDGTALPSDFFEARCVGSDGSVHVGLYSGIAVDPMVIERCRSLLKNAEDSRLDILIFGFDSVSRTSWMRQLPKSYEFIVNELGASVFAGYNIVGDGTPQALLPLLTGSTETELPEARRGFDGAQPVDEHPWIWRQLKNVDYVTQWAEDSAEIGTFTYRMLGFQHQPVNHYMRTFYLAVKRRYANYHTLCVGSTPRHVNMFAWQRQFFERYDDCRKFSFIFHSELSHDNSLRLPLADDDLRRHLAALRDAGHLDRAVLVLMSDHGPRFDHTRRTARGKYDERLPFLAVRLPASFAARYPTAAANLRLNAATGRLVTAFDIHATLLDVVRLVANQQEPNSDDGGRLARAISLFDEVPADRTCAEADIAPHWCACLRWRPLGADSAAVLHASQHVVDVINAMTSQHVVDVINAMTSQHVVHVINAMTSSHVVDVINAMTSQHVVDVINAMTSSHRRHCAELRLHDVLEGDLFADDDRLLQFRRSSDVHGRVPEMTDTVNATEVLYRVVIRTRPGDALFDATVRHPLSTDSIAYTFDVDSRQISRTNQYGRQPHCIMDTHPHLRPYCYCVVQESATDSISQ